MKPDDVIELVKVWRQFNYRSTLPESVVLASVDWLNYVMAMADLVPRDVPLVTYPTEEEVMWAWPEGVAIVMAEPPLIAHTIISKTDYLGERPHDTPPHQEMQRLAGLVIGIGQMMPTRIADGKNLSIENPVTGDFKPGPLASEVYAIPGLWIGTDPSDIVTSTWIPGGDAIVMGEEKMLSESTRFFLAVITALGHRLTNLGQPLYAGRGERRRVHRELPSLRVLSLSSGASVRSQEGVGAVAWSKRWLVRGHWRMQAYGPSHSLRRATWIDPFIKGPDDKPFDERPTVWRTE